MQELLIHSHIRDYPVRFVRNFSFLDSLVNEENIVFVVDRNLYELYKDYNFNKISKNKLILFDASEQNKVLDKVIDLYSILLEKQAKRNITLVSMGGGIVQDVTGFLASTLYRGIRWIYVPTTFLSQVDSCIGSKNSLNFLDYKNILGTFYAPFEVYINPDFLRTLDRKYYLSGLGEYVKFRLIKTEPAKNLSNIAGTIKAALVANEPNFFREMIKEGLMVKTSYIADDEYDLGRRNLLNYGHTLGHALESASNYAVPHGIAVTIGILYANILALRKGFLSEKVFNFVTEQIIFPIVHSVPDLLLDYFDDKILLEKMSKDKKKVGKGFAFIVPVSDNFELKKFDDFDSNYIMSALKELTLALNI